MEKASVIFLAFLQRNGMVAVVILAVFAVRALLRKCPKKYSYALWAIVGIRMLFDLPIASGWSLFNLFCLVKSRSQMSEIAHYTGVSGVHAQTAVQNVTQISAGSRVTGDAASEAGLTAAMTTSQKICAVLFFVWLIGIFLFLGYGMYSYIKCRSMVRTAVRLTVNETSGNVRRTIKIWECDCIPSPFVLGIFCPQIYIPFRMKEEEQQYILAHESWHIRRHDPLWKLIAFVLLAVYWWNPLAWIAFFYMTRDMEMSCDEAVLAQFGNQIKKGYSASLLAFAMERHPYSFAPVAFGEADAGRRIKNVLNFKKPHTWVAAIATLLIVIVAVSCLTNQKPSGTKAVNPTETVESTQEPIQENTVDAKTEQSIREWAQAFCDRDAAKIMKMTTEEAQADLEKAQLLWVDGDTPSFGWSSPWPWGSFGDSFGGTGKEMNGYWLHEINPEVQTAEILYYAETSDPHVSVWIENIHYTQKNGKFQITKEEINQFADSLDAKTDGISSVDEFDTAYAQGINDSQMDYRVNGMGKMLNKNMTAAGVLTEPTEAARQLLNLSSDEKFVSVEKDSESEDQTKVGLQITFLKSGEKRYICMIQPWGKNGIWIPAEGNETK